MQPLPAPTSAAPAAAAAASPGVSQELTQRLASLGVSLLQLTPEGHAAPLTPADPITSLLIRSPMFKVLAGRAWDELASMPGEAIELWQGLHLVNLTRVRRRRTDLPRTQGPLLVVPLLGTQLPESDQFRHACDAGGVDFRITLRRVNRGELMSESEIRRLASTLLWSYTDTQYRDRSTGELQGLSSELAESYEELSLLYQLSSQMRVNQPAPQFLERAVGELREVAGLGWLALRLTEADPRLGKLAGHTRRDRRVRTPPLPTTPTPLGKSG